MGWNVRTLCPGVNQGNVTRKTAELNRELSRLNIDICALSETRLAVDSGYIREKRYFGAALLQTIVDCTG